MERQCCAMNSTAKKPVMGLRLNDVRTCGAVPFFLPAAPPGLEEEAADSASSRFFCSTSALSLSHLGQGQVGLGLGLSTPSQVGRNLRIQRCCAHEKTSQHRREHGCSAPLASHHLQFSRFLVPSFATTAMGFLS